MEHDETHEIAAAAFFYDCTASESIYQFFRSQTFDSEKLWEHLTDTMERILDSQENINLN